MHVADSWKFWRISRYSWKACLACRMLDVECWILVWAKLFKSSSLFKTLPSILKEHWIFFRSKLTRSISKVSFCNWSKFAFKTLALASILEFCELVRETLGYEHSKLLVLDIESDIHKLWRNSSSDFDVWVPSTPGLLMLSLTLLFSSTLNPFFESRTVTDNDLFLSEALSKMSWERWPHLLRVLRLLKTTVVLLSSISVVLLSSIFIKGWLDWCKSLD